MGFPPPERPPLPSRAAAPPPAIGAASRTEGPPLPPRSAWQPGHPPCRHWRRRRPAGGWSRPVGGGGQRRGAPLRTGTRSRMETAASGTRRRSAPPPSRPRTAPSGFPLPSPRRAQAAPTVPGSEAAPTAARPPPPQGGKPGRDGPLGSLRAGPPSFDWWINLLFLPAGSGLVTWSYLQTHL